MKKIKHFALALAAVILLSNINYVQASELTAAETIQTNGEIGVMSARASKMLIFNRTRSTVTIGTETVTSSSTLILTMPRDNGRSLVQGKVYFLPLASNGTQYTFSFSNYSKEVQEIDLSGVEPGKYIVKVEAASVGTNTNVYVYYEFK